MVFLINISFKPINKQNINNPKKFLFLQNFF